MCREIDIVRRDLVDQRSHLRERSSLPLFDVVECSLDKLTRAAEIAAALPADDRKPAAAWPRAVDEFD